MDDKERWELVCEPTLKRIEAGVNKLMEVVVVGNGKPALTARVDLLEKAIVPTATPADSAKERKVVKFGPLELDGYSLKDVAVFAMLMGVAWTLISAHMERSHREAALEKIQKAAQVVLQKGAVP